MIICPKWYFDEQWASLPVVAAVANGDCEEVRRLLRDEAAINATTLVSANL